MFDWPEPPTDEAEADGTRGTLFARDLDEEAGADHSTDNVDREPESIDAEWVIDPGPGDYSLFGNLITLSAYRGMWVFAMFDLPVDTKEARKRYTRFRKALLRNGFCMLQFSVYARHCTSEDSTEGIRNAVRAELPPDGQVRLLGVTDRQFGNMEVYFGKTREKTEDPPAQFMLF